MPLVDPPEADLDPRTRGGVLTCDGLRDVEWNDRSLESFLLSTCDCRLVERGGKVMESWDARGRCRPYSEYESDVEDAVLDASEARRSQPKLVPLDEAVAAEEDEDWQEERGQHVDCELIKRRFEPHLSKHLDACRRLVERDHVVARKPALPSLQISIPPAAHILRDHPNELTLAKAEVGGIVGLDEVVRRLDKVRGREGRQSWRRGLLRRDSAGGR